MNQNLGELKSIEQDLLTRIDRDDLKHWEVLQTCADILKIRHQIRVQEELRGIGHETTRS